MTADAYIQSVIDNVPRGMPLREQLAMELGSHIAERVAHGQPLDAVLGRLGDPLTLAESYLAAIPLDSAPFWPRAFAKVIDFAIACTGAAAAALLVYLIVPPELGYFVPLFCILTFLALFPVYTALAEYTAGQTVGKKLMNIRVVRESGARIGLGQSLLRQLPFFAQFFWIDVLFALVTDRRQRAFELLTKTRAVMVLLCLMLLPGSTYAQRSVTPTDSNSQPSTSAHRPDGGSISAAAAACVAPARARPSTDLPTDPLRLLVEFERAADPIGHTATLTVSSLPTG